MYSKKHLIALFLAIVCVIGCFSTPVAAANSSDPAVPYASSYFASYSVTCTGADTGLKVKFDVVCPRTMTTVGANSVTIQKLINGKWETQRTDTYIALDLRNSNSKICNRTLNYSYSSGTYRAIIVYYACDSNGSDTKSLTSSSYTF